MGYGAHFDEGLMGQPPLRADLSYTLFLSAPEEYEGGELVLIDTEGEHPYKLRAGSLVLYPATFLHRVETVRLGSRFVAAGWIQSVCRSAGQREILLDLYRLMSSELEQRGKSAMFDVLSKTRANLLRLFAET
jgi:PKHD-type hydroxylase